MKSRTVSALGVPSSSAVLPKSTTPEKPACADAGTARARERGDERDPLRHHGLGTIIGLWTSPTTSAASSRRRPGLAHGRGPDPRLQQRGGARAHARDRRAAPLEPLARRAVAQGRDVRQHPARTRPAPGLRRRRAARAGRARRPRLPHRRAHLLSQRRPRAARAARGAAGARAHARRARRRAPRGLLHRRAARRPAADRRQGAGGGRGGRPRRARGDRRARRRGGRRRPLPPDGAAARRGRALADAEEVLNGRRR